MKREDMVRPRSGAHRPVSPYERAGYDFGLLKTRKTKVPQAQSRLVDISSGSTTDFERMSHDKIIDIVRKGKISEKRALSRWFFGINGIYARAVRYISDIMKFDYLLYPNLDLEEDYQKADTDKILKKFNELLGHFDSSSIQLMCREWAAQVSLEGAYYGYICDDINDKLVVQDLPVDYCRSRFYHKGIPLVEFNARYFDKVAGDDVTREKILSLFPDEFQKGYRQYKAGQLAAETSEDESGWFLLDINRAFKFSFFGKRGDDVPPFLNAIPSLLELDEVEDLEKEKLLQQIQKILVQQFKLDNNNQLPFTMTELQQLNSNAVDMVGDSVGVNVLSTIADVHVEDLEGTTTKEASTAVAEATNDVYNNLGLSTNLFNTSGNTALEKSIRVDEAYAKLLLLEYEEFFNRYIEWKFNKSKMKFRMKMLTTSIFNYEDLAKQYENLTKIGFSRFLPMVAMGHTQKEVISMAKLEQQIMQLDAYMLPPFSSNTMSSDTWSQIKAQQEQIFQGKENFPTTEATTDTDASSQNSEKSSEDAVGGAGEAKNEEKETGRPELADDEKSDKTLANEAAKG